MPRHCVTLAAVATCALMQGCGEPDRNQPYEYLRTEVVFATDNGSLQARDISTISTVLKWKRNYFRLNSGDCEARLSKLSDHDLQIQVSAWNGAVRDGMDQPLAVAFRLQCVANFGRDEVCVQRVNDNAKKIKDPQLLVDYMFTGISSCDRRREIGNPKVISLSEWRR
ncbi:conserved hypothetical protein [Cupriavidus taiwanensis]|uniref:Lipoprotein n=1 Tax=Cupriavidus taiwanensis TaxID=164546 RepID=A0A7Z7JIS0_9BURK|nr:conserved hypothetical protein [Cupriavidus taiwanensis]SOZ96391.1 conserved hypothetical protein [Cupriavidus taiwanensis]SPC25662.1 conserved hypothetical protein [Cupriavidus taiwanensis]